MSDHSLFGNQAIICGGTPTLEDLAKIQEFAAILEIKDERERRLATLEMMGVDTSEWRK